ncbi:MAG: hypothetical protein WBD99_11705 [Thermodesulfobacteriota bacterium]
MTKKITGKKLYILLIFNIFLFLSLINPGAGEEIKEDQGKGIDGSLIFILYPEMVNIDDENGVENIIMIVNLGDKPIDIGRLDPETGSVVGGDKLLRVSIDIRDAPLSYLRLGDSIVVSESFPYIRTNLVSGITLMPGSALWMTVSALPMDDMEKAEEGYARFSFTLLSMVEGKTEPMIDLGISILYKSRKRLEDSGRVQASIGFDRGNPKLSALQ